MKKAAVYTAAGGQVPLIGNKKPRNVSAPWPEFWVQLEIKKLMQSTDALTEKRYSIKLGSHVSRLLCK